MLVLGGAGALLAAAVIAAIVVFVASGGTSAQEALADAGCTVETYAGQSRDHVEQLAEDFEYNSSPPTTGPHSPVPAPWDLYDEPVSELHLVHALEHGSVAIQHGSGVSPETVDRIAAWYRDDPNGLIVAPYPALGDRIALSAWTAEPGEVGEGVQATCGAFDEAAFDAFVDEYGFRGPERAPRDQMTPGSA